MIQYILFILLIYLIINLSYKSKLIPHEIDDFLMWDKGEVTSAEFVTFYQDLSELVAVNLLVCRFGYLKTFGFKSQIVII